jgi:hypothetical protein
VGRGSFGYLIAQIAVETGIAPQYLLDLDDVMFQNVLKVLTDRAKAVQDANRGKRRVEARKALRKFEPDLAKELRKEMANLLKPIAKKGKGFIPSTVLSGWSKPASSDTEYRQFPSYDASEAKRGIGYRTSPS